MLGKSDCKIVIYSSNLKSIIIQKLKLLIIFILFNYIYVQEMMEQVVKIYIPNIKTR